MIISCDNPVKSYFDVFILLLVGYSCIMSLYNSAFTASTNSLIKIWDWVVEGFFYTDLILNFFHAYRDPDTLQPVTNYKLICEHYMSGWFIIDFVAVFPFQVMFSGGLMLKLVRLARMPRLIKLLDENRFKRVLQQCDSNDSISSIIRRQNNLAVYKLFRLIMIMILMVYGVACINYLLADYMATGTEELEKTFPTYFGLVD